MSRKLVAASTLGETLSSIDFSGFEVSEVRYAPGAHFATHAHQRSYVCLLLRGAFEERLGSRRHEVGSASVVVMPAGVEHSERFGLAGGRSLLVTLRQGEDDDQAGAFRTFGVFEGGAVVRAALAICRTVRGSRERATLEIGEHLIELLATAAGDPEPPSDGRAADRACELLAASPEEQLSLRSVAAAVGCHPAYLARAFRHRFGCTMSAWRRRLRAQRAARLLAGTDRPLAWIAGECGFADQSHLCRTLRRELGISPRELRLLARRS